ncbi:MAG: hypothetical protein ACFFCW_30595, partial [Candidatus Hodarchaeota archaeon]
VMFIRNNHDAPFFSFEFKTSIKIMRFGLPCKQNRRCWWPCESRNTSGSKTRTKTILIHPASKPLTVEDLAKNINDYFCYRRKVSEGTKGPIVYEFTRRRVILSGAGLPQKTVWLLLRRTQGDDPQYSYFISNASSSTRLKTLV